MSTDRKVIIDRIVIVLMIIAGATVIIMLCKSGFATQNNDVDIKNLVIKAITTENGYDSYMEKHMSEQVYKSSNVYIHHKSTKEQPIKVFLKLTEINKHKLDGKIFVYMNYSMQINDANGNLVISSTDTPVVYTYTDNNGQLYIEKSEAYESVNDVPNIYR